jgi:hypothetical protein
MSEFFRSLGFGFTRTGNQKRRFGRLLYMRSAGDARGFEVKLKDAQSK